MNKTDLEDLLLKGNLNLLPATFLDHKDSQIVSRVSAMMRYWPADDLHPTLLLFLLRLPGEFKKIRSVAHLRRVICAEYFYRKKVINAIDQYPHKRHLFIKLLKTQLEFPFGSKSVVGIVVTFNLMKQREAFEEGHILEAIRRIVPGVTVVKGSFNEHQDKKNQVHIVYLEIEREEQPEFTLDETNRLSKRLPAEFKGCIEQLVPMTFMRRNEEEVYRNILALRDQLRSTKDIPQATITFEEQTQFDLFFTVVLLRVVPEHKHLFEKIDRDFQDQLVENTQPPTLQELIEQQNPNVLFIPDRVDIVGNIRKKYRKEATVFRLQLSKKQFFRKDRSVNLYKARKRIVSMLASALGPIRDYNGGLILKQNERLEDFLALMPKVYDEFFLENFFYSITPIAMQSILPALLVKEWFLAFYDLLEKDLDRNDTYLLLSRQVEEAQLVIIRSEDRSFKDLLLKEINQLSIPSLELAFSEVNMHGAYCFGFLYRPSLVGKGSDFCNLVKETMEKWSARVGEDQTLRIALLGNEPSLDPRITKEDQGYIVIRMLFDGLTRIGPDGKPHLSIAESYVVSHDFKKYTFHLRDTKWSNGAPITAYDFEYSWKKALNPHTHSVPSHTLFLIKNGRLAKENKISLDEVGICAVDDKTLSVELEYPAPYFLQATAHWTYSLINRAIDQKYPGWAFQAGETYVCNGPFKLKEWKHSRAITVEKNPYYWDAQAVKLKKISISMTKPLQVDVGMVEKGEIDLLGRPMTSFSPSAMQTTVSDVERISFSLNGVFSLCFNTSQFPFNHKKIRQAFAYAINRDRMGKLVAHEFGNVSYSLLSKTLSLHPEPLFPNGDLQKARALFFEGLGEIGFVKSDFPRITVNYYSGHYRLELFKMLCQQWKEAFDIEIHLQNYEWETLLDHFTTGKYQIGGTEVNARWTDPLHLLERFENKKDISNITFWEHPKYKRIMALAKQASTIEERDHFLKQAESLLANEMPAVPLYQLAGNYLKRSGFEGIYTSENFHIDFKWAYKEK